MAEKRLSERVVRKGAVSVACLLLIVSFEHLLASLHSDGWLEYYLEPETQHGNGDHVYRCASHCVAVWELATFGTCT